MSTKAIKRTEDQKLFYYVNENHYSALSNDYIGRKIWAYGFQNSLCLLVKYLLGTLLLNIYYKALAQLKHKQNRNENNCI